MSIKGIDISHHQKGLKMSSVKKAGFEYVILRVGYSGSKNHSQVMDETFAGFYKAAKSLGLYIGVYFYGCAFTKEEAKKEGSWVKGILKPYPIDLPVYYDIEGDMLSKHKDSLTDLIASFRSGLGSDYRYGVYMSDSPISSVASYLDKNNISKWVARYGAKPKNTYDIWQYASTLEIDGHAVDMNTAEDSKLKGLLKKINFADSQSKKPEVKKTSSVTEVAEDVIRGKYGSGVARKERLEKQGYSYKAVQSEVNRLLRTKYYVVSLGDTLASIAKRKGVSVKKLADINGIENINKIYVGQVLKLK